MADWLQLLWENIKDYWKVIVFSALGSLSASILILICKSWRVALSVGAIAVMACAIYVIRKMIEGTD